MKGTLAVMAVACTTPLTAETLSLTCTPALPMYCENIHVGCSGRSRVPSQPFAVEGVEVRFTDNRIWQVSARYDDRATVLRRTGTRDWIRIQTGGAYSIRIYRKGRGLMMRGQCTLGDSRT